MFLITDMNKSRFIKTECGLDKFSELETGKGLLARIRLFWFVFFASVRDSLKR